AARRAMRCPFSLVARRASIRVHDVKRASLWKVHSGAGAHAPPLAISRAPGSRRHGCTPIDDDLPEPRAPSIHALEAAVTRDGVYARRAMHIELESRPHQAWEEVAHRCAPAHPPDVAREDQPIQ